MNTTITTKGQVLIPKPIRDAMGLVSRAPVTIEYDAVNRRAILKAGKDIVDLAGTIRPQKGKTVLGARREYEKNYKRV
ncbi:MAG: AbrB/MazE/SpoVT family DNA-binding domain-containing protein [Candidatus Pacebacteria bacterium]|nr:AbrB/MazE/SpoVT family DNA-binding domain-containing protein [Candidatus Paceibacterota bacterium]